MAPKKRYFAKFIAMIRGKFFTDCPRCGHRFGGHEPHAHQVTFQDESGSKHYRYVCGACAKDGKAA